MIVRRTNLRDGTTEELSNKPNAKGEYMDVPLLLARRVKHPRHAIFGTKGREVWFGGQVYATHTELDQVWQEIESRTPYREVNFDLWPAGQLDLMHCLFIPVDDFNEVEASALVAPELEVDDNGTPVWKYTDETGNQFTHVGDEPPDSNNSWERPVVKRRNIAADWRRPEVLAALDVTVAEVEDRTKPVDRRRRPQLQDPELLRNKQEKRPGRRIR
jgi:hypothetical protein